MEKVKTTSSGMSLGTILFLIFLVLKLAEIGPVANWSWWWVTSPLWIPVLIIIFIWILLVGGAAIITKLLK